MSEVRITEALRLRVQDIDFEYKQLTVRFGKGNKDRVTTFPGSLETELKLHFQRVKLVHEQDMSAGYGAVYLPHALNKKYPRAEKNWGWQYAFPARILSTDPRSGVSRGHHIDQSVINKSIKGDVCRLNITKRVSAHTFRHSFATHLSARHGYPRHSSFAGP